MNSTVDQTELREKFDPPFPLLLFKTDPKINEQGAKPSLRSGPVSWPAGEIALLSSARQTSMEEANDT